MTKLKKPYRFPKKILMLSVVNPRFEEKDPHRILRTLIACILFCGAVLTALQSDAADTSDLDEAQLSRLKKGEILLQVRRSERESKGWVEAVVFIDVPAETIWRVMTDCEGAPGFVPGLKACQVLDSGKNWEIIRHDVKWMWFLPKVYYVFRADYQINRQIDFWKIRGDLRDMRGTWRLYPVNHGRQTVVQYGVYLDPGFFVPKWIVRQALKKQLPKVLAALRTNSRISYSVRESDK